MTTLRQIEANRRNSLKSCGPRTDSGKDVSKRNALKHGLAGAGIVLPEDEAEIVRERFPDWALEFRPKTETQRWLVEVMVINSVRLDRCMDHESEERATQIIRAGLCWDDDHKLAAKQLGQTLSKRPSVVASQLEQTPQGCDWLIGSWESLGRILIEKGEWNEVQRSMALDLLGTPAALRDDPARLGPKDGLGDLIRSEVDRLSARKAVAALLDDRNCELTKAGVIDETIGPLALARRYEARCARLLQWAIRQFYRLTLGVGLDDPSLGGPTLGAGDPDPLDYLIEMATAPVPDQDGNPTPAPAAKVEPAPRREPKPVPSLAEPMKKVTSLPIPATSAPLADRPIVRFAPKPPKPARLNRRERRAEKARARRAAKV